MMRLAHRRYRRSLKHVLVILRTCLVDVKILKTNLRSKLALCHLRRFVPDPNFSIYLKM